MTDVTIDKYLEDEHKYTLAVESISKFREIADSVAEVDSDIRRVVSTEGHSLPDLNEAYRGYGFEGAISDIVIKAYEAIKALVKKTLEAIKYVFHKLGETIVRICKFVMNKFSGTKKRRELLDKKMDKIEEDYEKNMSVFLHDFAEKYKSDSVPKILEDVGLTNNNQKLGATITTGLSEHQADTFEYRSYLLRQTLHIKIGELLNVTSTYKVPFDVFDLNKYVEDKTKTLQKIQEDFLDSIDNYHQAIDWIGDEEQQDPNKVLDTLFENLVIDSDIKDDDKLTSTEKTSYLGPTQHRLIDKEQTFSIVSSDKPIKVKLNTGKIEKTSLPTKYETLGDVPILEFKSIYGAVIEKAYGDNMDVIERLTKSNAKYVDKLSDEVDKLIAKTDKIRKKTENPKIVEDIKTIVSFYNANENLLHDYMTLTMKEIGNMSIVLEQLYDIEYNYSLSCLGLHEVRLKELNMSTGSE